MNRIGFCSILTLLYSYWTPYTVANDKCLCLQMQNYKNQGKSFLNAQCFCAICFTVLYLLFDVKFAWRSVWIRIRFECRKMSWIGVDFQWTFFSSVFGMAIRMPRWNLCMKIDEHRIEWTQIEKSERHSFFLSWHHSTWLWHCNEKWSVLAIEPSAS